MDEKTKAYLLNEAERFNTKIAPAIDRLMKADPKLTYIGAMIMAQDLAGIETADEMLAEGATYHQAQARLGSFARMGWSVNAYEKGLVDADTFFSDLPDLWRGSDPDDTDPKFLRIWLQARKWNKDKYLRDGEALPRGALLTIYRGQDEDANFGIAWSLDKGIAEKFAHGAATRQMNRGGVVYEALYPRVKVLGYLTGRKESEVIVNPLWLMVPK